MYVYIYIHMYIRTRTLRQLSMLPRPSKELFGLRFTCSSRLHMRRNGILPNHFDTESHGHQIPLRLDIVDLRSGTVLQFNLPLLQHLPLLLLLLPLLLLQRSTAAASTTIAPAADNK